MKRIYIQPTTKVVEIKEQASLLAGSPKIDSQGLDGDPITSGGYGDAEDEGA